MNTKKERTIAIVAAFTVLFSAIWGPLISVVVLVVVLVAFGFYRFVQKDN